MCVVLVIVVLNRFANLVRVAKLDGISQFVMAYGGLRGAIAFSLAVVLDKHRFQSRQLFITTTIVVVYFTNIVLVSRHNPDRGAWCASGCVVECRICNWEVAGSNLGLDYFAPRSTQLSIPPGSVNEYQL